MQLFDLEYYASLEDIKTWFFWGRVYYLLLCRPRRPSSCSQLHNYILFRQHRLNHINLGHATKKFSFSRQSCVIQNLPGWTGRKGQNRSTHNYTECLTCSIHQSMWCPKGGGGGWLFVQKTCLYRPPPIPWLWYGLIDLGNSDVDICNKSGWGPHGMKASNRFYYCITLTDYDLC